MLLVTTNGSMTNLTAPPNGFIKFLSNISASRFVNEGIFRCCTNTVPNKTFHIPGKGDIVVSQAKLLAVNGFDIPNDKSLVYLTIWIAFWVVLSLFFINYKYRKL